MPDQAEQIIADLERKVLFLENKVRAITLAGDDSIVRAVDTLFIAATSRGATPNQPNFIDKTDLFDRIDEALQFLNPLVRRG